MIRDSYTDQGRACYARISPASLAAPDPNAAWCFVFLMMHFIPGDPVTNMMGETYSAEDARNSAMS